MGKTEFLDQLKALGFDPQELGGSRVAVAYVVLLGKNAGKHILLGFDVGNDFPMNCPTGFHIKAIDPGWIEHSQNVQNSPNEFGHGWRYWSRPFHEWGRSGRNVKVYLAHIKNVLMTV